MPQAAAAAVVSALFSTTSVAVLTAAGASTAIGAALVYGSVYVGTAMAGSLALNAITQKAPDRPQGAMIQADISTDAPRRLQIGERINGGVKVDWYTGDNNNDNWRIYYLGEGPMGPLNRVLVDGLEVISTPIASGQTQALSGKWDRVQITYYDGTQTVADPTLLAANVGLKSTSVGVGCAYAIVKARFHDEFLFLPPNVSFELSGALFYDRRLDDTAGGAGTQRLRDPSTWAPSKNPMVVLDHYMQGRYSNALEVRPLFGMGENPELMPYDKFEAQANLCDEQVTLADNINTQARYEVNGFLFANNDHKTVILKLCQAMNARAVDLGGEFSVISGEAKTPVVTIYDDDIDENAPTSYSPKSPFSNLVNGVQGTYQDVSGNYLPAPYPLVTDDTFVDEDGGDPKITPLNLDLETNVERAQRLAWLYLKRKRRQATIELVLPFKFYILEDGDWFVRDGARFAGGKTFEVVGSPVLDPITLTVSISGVEVDPSDVAWQAGYASDAIQAPVQPTPVDTLPTPTAAITAVYVQSGSIQLPSIRIENTQFEDDPPSRMEIQVRRESNVTEAMVRSIPEGVQYEHVVGLPPSTLYEVRTRAKIGRFSSAWTGWQQVTTLSNYTVPVSAAAIEAALGTVLTDAEAAREQIAELIISLQVRLEDALANLADRGRIDGVKVGTKIRSVQNEIVEGDRALAQTVEEVIAQSNDARAAIINQQTAIADDLSSEAERISLLVVQMENAYSELARVDQTIVTANEALSASIAAQSARITDVERGTSSVASSLQSVITRVRRNESGLSANSQAITVLNADIDDVNNGLTGQSQAISSLTARVITAEDSVSSFSSQVTQLTGEIGGLNANFSVVSDALQVIQNSIEAAGGSINVNLDSILSLSAQVEDLATGQSANNNLIVANSLRINNLDGVLTATNQTLTSLNSQVGDFGSELAVLGQTVASLEGSLVEYAIRGVAGSSEFEFYAVATDQAPSQMVFRADQIRFDGNVVVDGTLTAEKLVPNATTDRGRFTGVNTDFAAGNTWVNVMSGNIPNETGAEVEFRFDCDFTRNANAGLNWRLQVNGAVIQERNIYAAGPNLTQVEGVEYFTCPDDTPFILQMRVQPNQSGARVTGLRGKSIVNKN